MRKRKKSAKAGIILIKKANNLIESRYKFDIWETRFFLSVLAQIRKEDDDFHTYRIWYKDMIKTFGLKSGDSYSLLRDAAKSLMSKQFHVNYEKDGFIRETAYQILITADYLKESQEGKRIEQQEYIDIKVHSEMKPFLLQLQQNFTAYDLRNVVKLGVYPVRVYELLKQYQNIGSRTLEVEEIKRMFGVTEQYQLFGDFLRWIIKPSIREINAHTDLTVTSWEKVKEGKKVVALRFFFRRKTDDELYKTRGNQMSNQLPLFDFSEEVEEVAQELPAELQEDYKRLSDWWGVEQDEFAKRADGKSKKELEDAIEFTKSRIKAGKASNPAGVFLDALSKGHKSIEQHRAEKKVKEEQRQREKRKALQPMIEEYEKRMAEYNKEVNNLIRSITQEHPEETEKVIQRLKEQFPAFQDKTIEEFRKNSTLRGMVKGEIMKNHPERFKELHVQEGSKIQEVRSKILEIEPGYKF